MWKTMHGEPYLMRWSDKDFMEGMAWPPGQEENPATSSVV
jgi:hypothetical protein